MPYRSKAQVGLFHANPRLKKLAKRFDRETFTGKSGGRENKRRYASLPQKVKRKK